VGGGGLLLGAIKGLEKVGWLDVPIVAVETTGSASLFKSLKEGKSITLEGIDTIAKVTTIFDTI
jgi:L-serine/L-threonine ammonia-lyase